MAAGRLQDTGEGKKTEDGGSVIAYCKECLHFRYCIERSRDIPCTGYERRKRSEGIKRNKPGTDKSGSVSGKEEKAWTGENIQADH